MAELLHRTDEGISLNVVDGAVAVFGGDDGLVAPGVAQVEGDRAGIVHIQAEYAGLTAEQHQVVAGVEAGLVLGVGEIIGAPGAVAMAALVHAANALAQAEDLVILVHMHAERDGIPVLFHGETRHIAGAHGLGDGDGVGEDGAAVIISADHEDFVPFLVGILLIPADICYSSARRRFFLPETFPNAGKFAAVHFLCFFFDRGDGLGV